MKRREFLGALAGFTVAAIIPFHEWTNIHISFDQAPGVFMGNGQHLMKFLATHYDLWQSEEGQRIFLVRDEQGHPLAFYGFRLRQKQGGPAVEELTDTLKVAA